METKACLSGKVTLSMTFPRDKVRFDPEYFGWVSVFGGSVEAARVSSAEAVVCMKNPVGDG